MPDRERGRGRGQSETIGFVLVFGIIVTSVVLVTGTGYGGLQQVQEAERTNNAVKGFEILAGNVDELARGSPSRETELTLAGAGLSFGENVTVWVNATHPTDATKDLPPYRHDLKPLVYDPGTGSTLVYENGAVVRVDRHGMVMIKEPRLRLTASEAVIPVLLVQSPETQAVGGQSTVIVRTTLNETVPINTTTVPYDVTIKIKSARADAWERYFSEQACDTVTRNDDKVSCEIRTDRAYATLVRIDARFE